MIIPDLPDFATTDGKVISGRVQYNRYCKEKGVTNPADFKEQWAKQAEQRNKLFTPGSGHDRERRRAELARNYKEFKTYGEYKQMIENIGRRK